MTCLAAAAERETPAETLTATFVRRRGNRDHVYVTRADGSTCDWAFPSYGDQVPHDLRHVVVEEVLGIANGFWGLVAQGTEVEFIDNQGLLVKDGHPLGDCPKVDLSDLVRAEDAVAQFAPTGVTVETLGTLAVARLNSGGQAVGDAAIRGAALGFSSAEEVPTETQLEIRARLDQLGQTWRLLDDGGSITVTFTTEQ